jgi:glycosyltransferase involved in cell wall biosynthesis
MEPVTETMISIVVPVYNEQESMPALVAAVRAVGDRLGDWELLLIDDGSTDATVPVIRGLAADDRRIRLIRLSRNYGQTTAMQAGFDHARGEVVVSMDGDLQNDPSDIPMLVARLAEGYDLVSGYRQNRQDRMLTRKVPSWIANRIIRGITGVPIRDNGCSLKAYRRELLQRLHLYSDMHRFIPAVAAATAGARISEIPVNHHARRYGTSKYGLSRVLKVLADLLTIKMIRSFRNRPLLMFAMGAIVAALVSLSFAAAAFVSLIVTPEYKYPFVLPGASLLWLGVSSFLVMLGLIGETALRRLYDGPGATLPILREAPLAREKPW